MVGNYDYEGAYSKAIKTMALKPHGTKSLVSID